MKRNTGSPSRQVTCSPGCRITSRRLAAIAGLVWFLVAIWLVLVSSAVSFAAEEVVVRGNLANLTGGPTPVANQEVTLHRTGEKTEDITQKTVSDAQGNFEFRGLVGASYYKYFVEVAYQDVRYVSEQVSFAQGETIKELNLNVYETTTDPKSLSLDVEHVLVDVGDGLIMVNEIMVVRNSSDKAYVGNKVDAEAKSTTLRFYLPEGATELAPGEGLDQDGIMKTSDGFAYTKAIPPGTRNVAFMYHLNFSSSRFSFSKKVSYPTGKLFVLTQDTKPRVEIQGLKSQGQVPIQQKNYWSFSGEKLKPGFSFTASFKGLKGSGSSNALILWVAVVLMLGLIGVLAAYSLLRDKLRRKETMEEREMDPRGLLRQERRDLLSAIAELDDRFENGAIPGEAYYSERERKKSRLVEIIQELRGRRVEEQSET